VKQWPPPFVASIFKSDGVSHLFWVSRQNIQQGMEKTTGCAQCPTIIQKRMGIIMENMG
jgi:hypothetical protein